MSQFVNSGQRTLTGPPKLSPRKLQPWILRRIFSAKKRKQNCACPLVNELTVVGVAKLRPLGWIIFH
jgi:hypothetical protein